MVQGMYDDGPSALRARRLAKMKQLGIIGKDVIPHEEYTSLADGRPYIQWEQMSAEQKAKSARAMETYAGMVDCIDRNVGKVMDYLEKIGEADSKRDSLPRIPFLIHPRHVCLFHVRQWLRRSSHRGMGCRTRGRHPPHCPQILQQQAGEYRQSRLVCLVWS